MVRNRDRQVPPVSGRAAPLRGPWGGIGTKSDPLGRLARSQIGTPGSGAPLCRRSRAVPSGAARTLLDAASFRRQPAGRAVARAHSGRECLATMGCSDLADVGIAVIGDGGRK